MQIRLQNHLMTKMWYILMYHTGKQKELDDWDIKVRSYLPALMAHSEICFEYVG